MSTTPSLLRELNGLNVLVVHPQDNELRVVTSHLQRIGCVVQHCWPVPKGLPATDVAILAVEMEQRDTILALCAGLGENAPPIIAIVGYENPSTLQLLLETRPAAVIERPLKPFGLLTQVLMARVAWKRKVEMLEQIRQLQVKHSVVSKISMAKTLLMLRHGYGERDAHKRIQRDAMSQRCSMGAVAEAIIAHHSHPPNV